MTGDPDRLILLGEIGAAHGIKGEVTVRSFTEDPADIAAYGPLTDKTGQRTFTIAGLRVTPKAIIARFAGIADRNAAERLRNTGLYVRRSRLPPPDQGAYYHEDLVGMDAVAPDGRPIGKLTAVVNYGAGDLLEIAVPGERDTRLIPFTNEAVPTVDLAARRVVVVEPAFAEEEEGDAPALQDAGDEDGAS